ncbi:ankyrin repeat domain-containing protein [Aeromonas veronii]|nr:ankyrin repeat domain-containing protein [Aeromonas veronii]
MVPNRLLLSLLVVLVGLSEPAWGSEPTEAEQFQPASLQEYFFAAARSGEVSVLNEFVKAGFPIDERNEQSYTALMIAAYQGQSEAVKSLLERGADPCLRDKRGHTALMGAVIKGEWRIAKTLYAIDCDWDSDKRADEPVTDKSTMTAAQFAEHFGQGERFRALAIGAGKGNYIEGN